MKTPYKNASILHITQGYGVNPLPYQPKGHLAIDFCPINCYGMFQTALEDCYVANIIDSDEMTEDLKPMEQGYGIVLRSCSDPYLYYLYWHCLPIFPCEIGDYVNAGQIIAQFGNSGNCYSAGKYVPLSERFTNSKKGTHLHFEVFIEKGGIRTHHNPLDYIDFNDQPNYSILDVIKATSKILTKMLKLKR
jgi:hypothetical protein